MPPRDSAATRKRILDAATAEFAQFGLAGARVDRIADRAEANKQLIYAYYGSKEKLFDDVLEANIELVLDAVPFQADDLPSYAGALFDFAVAHPELARLVRWHQLERPGMLNRLTQTAESNERKLAALADAQAAGKIAGALPPVQLLAVLLAVIHGGAESYLTDGEPQRESVVAAVHRLTRA